jgi:ATP-dependent RNA helicase DDX55/SPB4
MLKDRDFLVKGKRALISYLRSYTEHTLSSIFDLDKMDIYDTTRSFILPIVPKLKEFRTDPDRRIIDQTFLEQSEAAEFANPNQARQFQAKEVLLLAKREKMEEEQAAKRARADREKSHKKRRSKSDRQKSKYNQEEMADAEMAYESTLLRKLRRGVISQAEFDRKMERLDQQTMRDLTD